MISITIGITAVSFLAILFFIFRPRGRHSYHREIASHAHSRDFGAGK